MGRKEKPLPPGPSRRPDQMTEEDQQKLREYQRARQGSGKEGAAKKETPPGSASGENTEEPSPRK